MRVASSDELPVRHKDLPSRKSLSRLARAPNTQRSLKASTRLLLRKALFSMFIHISIKVKSRVIRQTLPAQRSDRLQQLWLSF